MFPSAPVAGVETGNHLSDRAPTFCLLSRFVANPSAEFRFNGLGPATLLEMGFRKFGDSPMPAVGQRGSATAALAKSLPPPTAGA